MSTCVGLFLNEKLVSQIKTFIIYEKNEDVIYLLESKNKC